MSSQLGSQLPFQLGAGPDEEGAATTGLYDPAIFDPAIYDTGGGSSEPPVGTGYIAFRINQTAQSTSASGSIANGVGLVALNRSAAGATQAYKNGIALTVDGNPNQTSAALVNADLNVGRTTAAIFSSRQFSAAFAGGSLTAGEQAALYAILSSYMNSVGA